MDQGRRTGGHLGGQEAYNPVGSCIGKVRGWWPAWGYWPWKYRGVDLRQSSEVIILVMIELKEWWAEEWSEKRKELLVF